MALRLLASAHLVLLGLAPAHAHAQRADVAWPAAPLRADPPRSDASRDLAGEAPHSPERRARVALQVRRGAERANVVIEASSEHPDDALTLHLRVPGESAEAPRGLPFEERFGLAMLGSLIGSAIGGAVGLLATIASPEDIGWGVLGGAVAGGPIGATVGAAFGTASDTGSVLGAVTGWPAGVCLGGIVAVVSLTSTESPELALSTAWVVGSLVSALISSAWTGLDEGALLSPKQRLRRRSLTLSPFGASGTF